MRPPRPHPQLLGLFLTGRQGNRVGGKHRCEFHLPYIPSTDKSMERRQQRLANKWCRLCGDSQFHLPRVMLRRIEAQFEACDLNNDGTIDREEAADMLQRLSTDQVRPPFDR